MALASNAPRALADGWPADQQRVVARSRVSDPCRDRTPLCCPGASSPARCSPVRPLARSLVSELSRPRLVSGNLAGLRRARWLFGSSSRRAARRHRCPQLVNVLGAARRERLVGNERHVSLCFTPQLSISGADAVVGAKRVVVLVGDAVVGIGLGSTSGMCDLLHRTRSSPSSSVRRASGMNIPGPSPMPALVRRAPDRGAAFHPVDLGDSPISTSGCVEAISGDSRFRWASSPSGATRCRRRVHRDNDQDRHEQSSSEESCAHRASIRASWSRRARACCSPRRRSAVARSIAARIASTASVTAVVSSRRKSRTASATRLASSERRRPACLSVISIRRCSASRITSRRPSAPG